MGKKKHPSVKEKSAKKNRQKPAKEKLPKSERKHKQHKRKPGKEVSGDGGSPSCILSGRVCPCCKKHCPLLSPKCSKGKAIRKKLLAHC